MKPKNYTDKSAMLVGTDADPVTAGQNILRRTHRNRKKKMQKSGRAVCTTTKPRTHR